MNCLSQARKIEFVFVNSLGRADLFLFHSLILRWTFFFLEQRGPTKGLQGGSFHWSNIHRNPSFKSTSAKCRLNVFCLCRAVTKEHLDELLMIQCKGGEWTNIDKNTVSVSVD